MSRTHRRAHRNLATSTCWHSFRPSVASCSATTLASFREPCSSSSTKRFISILLLVAWRDDGQFFPCRREMDLTTQWHEAIVSSTIAAAWVFALVGGYLSGNTRRVITCPFRSGGMPLSARPRHCPQAPAVRVRTSLPVSNQGLFFQPGTSGDSLTSGGLSHEQAVPGLSRHRADEDFVWPVRFLIAQGLRY